MNRDTLALAVLVGLGLTALTLLAALDRATPEALTYVVTALVGALTGASIPNRLKGR